MKTIEQLLKTTIQNALNVYVNAYHYETVSAENAADETIDYTVQLTNDLRFHDKNSGANVIPGRLNTGSGVCSNIPGFHAVQSALSVMFEVPTEFLQQFLGCLALYIGTNNGVVSTVTDTLETDATADDITYSYKIDYDIPIPSGSPYKTVVKSIREGVSTETAEVMMVLLRGTLTYSEDQNLDDRTVYIESLTSFPWEASNSANWNAAGNAAITVNGATNNASSNLNAASTSWIEGRVFFNNAYAYYRSNGYTELEGITSFVPSIDYAVASTQGVNNAAMDYAFENAIQTYSVAFTRNKTDALHARIAAMPYANVASNSADMNMMVHVTSLSVNAVMPVKVTKIQCPDAGGFETVNMTVIKDV